MNGHKRGFTLLEVLVALAIFAVTALALMKISINYTQSIENNRLRTAAHFVAMNVAAEINIHRQWLSGSAAQEREEQGETWQVTQTAQATISPDVQRITIQVDHIDAQSRQKQGMATLTVFQHREVAP